MKKTLGKYSVFSRLGYRILLNVLIAIGAVLLALMYGMLLPVYGSFALEYFAIPVAAIFLLAIVLLPKRATLWDRFLYIYLLVLLVFWFLWPPYLSVIPLPGDPWMSPQRIMIYLLAAIGAILLSASSEHLDRLKTNYVNNKVVFLSVLGLLLLSGISVFFSDDISASFSMLIREIMFNYLLFLMSSVIFHSGERVEAFFKTCVVCGSLLGLASIYEAGLDETFWSAIIPASWFGSGPDIAEVLTATFREGLMRSKVSSITPLELAELLALIFPISLFFLLDDERVDHKILASFAILVLVAGIFYTRSRLGLIVSVATILNFLFIWALEKWKNHKRGLLGPAILLLYPAGMMTVLGAILFSNRLSLLFLGGAGHEGSNQARIDQWSSGLPIIAENPLFGHGLFQSAAVLGYRTPGGSLTIDSMYLSLALETGVISVILFIVFLSMSSIKGARTYIGGKDAGGLARTGNALASILFSVLIIKLVLSQRNNHTLIFLVLGIMTNMPNLAKKGKDKLLNYRFSANQIVEKRSAGQ